MEYQQILEQLKKYFCDLLIIQYKASEKNKALINMLADLIFADMLILQIKDLCVDVDKSKGVQLDVVADWVQCNRFYQGNDEFTHPYFSMPTYAQIKKELYASNMGGLSDYENFDTSPGGFLMYQNDIDVKTTFSKLNDNLFRPLIKLKIIKNSINHTNKNIDEAIWKWSSGNVYTTWEQPMQVTYNYNSLYTSIVEMAQQKNLLPAPTGVAVNLRYVE